MIMLKYLILIFLIFFSNFAKSNDWQLVYENTLNEDKVFIDVSNIKKKR